MCPSSSDLAPEDGQTGMSPEGSGLGPQALGPALPPLPSDLTFKPFLFLKLWLLLLRCAVVLVPEAFLQSQDDQRTQPFQTALSLHLTWLPSTLQDPAPEVGLTKLVKGLLSDPTCPAGPHRHSDPAGCNHTVKCLPLD